MGHWTCQKVSTISSTIVGFFGTVLLLQLLDDSSFFYSHVSGLASKPPRRVSCIKNFHFFFSGGGEDLKASAGDQHESLIERCQHSSSRQTWSSLRWLLFLQSNWNFRCLNKTIDDWNQLFDGPLKMETFFYSSSLIYLRFLW